MHSVMSDIIVISGLAIKVQTFYKKDYRHIFEEVEVLRALIDRVAQHFRSTTMSSNDRQYGEKILRGCQSVLEDLNSLMEKYRRRVSTNHRLAFMRVRLGNDVTALQVRLISNTVSLNGFVRRYAQCCPLHSFYRY